MKNVATCKDTKLIFTDSLTYFSGCHINLLLLILH